MITNAINLQTIVNLPKEIFQANRNLQEKMMKLAVAEKVGESTSPTRHLDIYV